MILKAKKAISIILLITLTATAIPAYADSLLRQFSTSKSTVAEGELEEHLVPKAAGKWEVALAEVLQADKEEAAKHKQDTISMAESISKYLNNMPAGESNATIAAILKQCAGATGITTENLKRNLMLSFYKEGENKHVFKLTFETTEGREFSTSIIVKSEKPAHQTDIAEEIGILRQLDGKAGAPRASLDFKTTDGTTAYFVEFVPGKDFGEAEEEDASEQTRLHNGEAIAATLFEIYDALGGRAPTDAHRYNFIKREGTDRAVPVDFDYTRKQTFSELFLRIYYLYFQRGFQIETIKPFVDVVIGHYGEEKAEALIGEVIKTIENYPASWDNVKEGAGIEEVHEKWQGDDNFYEFYEHPSYVLPVIGKSALDDLNIRLKDVIEAMDAGTKASAAGATRRQKYALDLQERYYQGILGLIKEKLRGNPQAIRLLESDPAGTKEIIMAARTQLTHLSKEAIAESLAYRVMDQAAAGKSAAFTRVVAIAMPRLKASPTGKLPGWVNTYLTSLTEYIKESQGASEKNEELLKIISAFMSHPEVSLDPKQIFRLRQSMKRFDEMSKISAPSRIKWAECLLTVDILQRSLISTFDIEKLRGLVKKGAEDLIMVIDGGAMLTDSLPEREKAAQQRDRQINEIWRKKTFEVLGSHFPDAPDLITPGLRIILGIIIENADIINSSHNKMLLEKFAGELNTVLGPLANSDTIAKSAAILIEEATETGVINGSENLELLLKLVKFNALYFLNVLLTDAYSELVADRKRFDVLNGVRYGIAEVLRNKKNADSFIAWTLRQDTKMIGGLNKALADALAVRPHLGVTYLDTVAISDINTIKQVLDKYFEQSPEEIMAGGGAQPSQRISTEIIREKSTIDVMSSSA